MTGRLRPYLGAGANYLNLTGILSGTVENCFYGNVIAAREIVVNQIRSYSDQIPQAEVEDMVEEAIDFIKRYIWKMIKENADDWSWHFDLTPRGDIKLLQLARCRPHNPQNLTDLLRKDVETSLENGDWVSSSLREYLGV
ncbi:hypothetical protein D3C71_1247160 [compost metagenome]